MENVAVTNDTIVQWNLDHLTVSDFGGTIDPLKLDGDILAETTGFEVFDRSYRSPARKHMIGVHAATARMRFGVRADALQFMNSRVTFGASEVFASVSVGFHNELWLSIGKGSKIDLADASPLIDIPMAGMAQVTANMAGIASTAELTGDLSIDDFVFAGFPLRRHGELPSSFQAARHRPVGSSGFEGDDALRRPDRPTRLRPDATMIADAQVKSDRLDFATSSRCGTSTRSALRLRHFRKGKVDAQSTHMGGKRIHAETAISE